MSEFSIFQSGQNSSLDRFVLSPIDISPAFTHWVFGKDFFFCHVSYLLGLFLP